MRTRSFQGAVRRGQEAVPSIILVKRVHAVKHTFWQTFVVHHEEQMSLLVILVAFKI